MSVAVLAVTSVAAAVVAVGTFGVVKLRTVPNPMPSLFEAIAQK